MIDKIEKMFRINDEIDEKSLEFLANAIQKNNKSGFDYVEFKKAFEALIDMPMDRTLAMKSAFTTGTTVGLTKDELKSSAEFYKQVLYTEKSHFDAALKNQNQQKIEEKRKEQEKLSKSIERNQEMIESLQQEISKYKENVEKIDLEIEDSIKRIESSRYKFEHTFAAVLNQMNTDILDIEAI